MPAWYESDNPSTVVRGGSWRLALWIIFVVLFIGLISVGIWAFGVGTSDVKGRGDAYQTKNSGTNRIRAQEEYVQTYNDILAQFGKFLGYWTIKGKVSSTQSQMTPSDLTSYACDDGLNGCQAQIVSAPGDDGSYGPNESGVFFFTTEGAMVQLPEDAYVYMDQPIAIGDIPELNGEGKVKGAE